MSELLLSYHPINVWKDQEASEKVSSMVEAQATVRD